MTIDYAKRWLVTKTVKNTEVETVANFLIQEIFMHYESLKELTSDNSTNLLANVIKYYL